MWNVDLVGLDDEKGEEIAPMSEEKVNEKQGKDKGVMEMKETFETKVMVVETTQKVQESKKRKAPSSTKGSKEERSKPPPKVKSKPFSSSQFKHASPKNAQECRIVIYAKLDDIPLQKLLELLNDHRDDIGYSIDAIEGIGVNSCLLLESVHSDSPPT